MRNGSSSRMWYFVGSCVQRMMKQVPGAIVVFLYIKISCILVGTLKILVYASPKTKYMEYALINEDAQTKHFLRLGTKKH